MDIQVYNPRFELTWLLDTYESLIWTIRYQECGDFEIATRPTATLVERIYPGCYLKVKESDRTMIVEEMHLSSDPEDGEKMIISGRSLESILDRRIIWKDLTIQDKTVNDTIKKILTDNLINPKNTDGSIYTERQISNFEYVDCTDEQAKIKMDANYRGDNVYTTITNIIKANKLGLKVVDSDGKFICSLYSGKDRTSAASKPFVRFSPDFDNLLNSNYSVDFKTYKTVALVGGEDPDYYYQKDGGSKLNMNDWTVGQKLPSGKSSKNYLIEDSDAGVDKYAMYDYQGSSWVRVGTATKKYEKRIYATWNASTSMTGIDRREMFFDGSGIKSKTEDDKKLSDDAYKKLLANAGKDEIKSNYITTVFDGDVDYNGMFQLYRDYDIGDIVEVSDGHGHGMSARISEIIISDDTSDGLKIFPSFTNIEEEDEDKA